MFTYVGGPPSALQNLQVRRGCINAAVSWNPVSSDEVCGPVSYNVTLTSSDGVVMMRTIDTSYDFTGLTPNNNYTVTVAGRNVAGVGSAATEAFSAAGKYMLS